MTEHLTYQQIEDYHRHTLDPAQLVWLDEHTRECAECLFMLNAASPGEDRFHAPRKVLDSTSIADHVSDADLAAYAERKLNAVDEEAVQSHLAACARCELLASDHVVFTDEVATNLNTRSSPPAVEVLHETSQSLPLRLSAKLSSLFSIESSALAFGMGALSMLIVGGFVWLIVRANRSGTTQPQVVQTASPSPSPSMETGVQPGASPSPSPSPLILVALNDNARQVGLDERGNLVGFDDLPPNAREMVKNALVTQQPANLATLADVGSQQGTQRSGQSEGPGFSPLSPVGKVVFGVRPTLRWTKLEGATEYRVELYDSSSSLVASSPPLTTISWAPPIGLERGEVYSWTVTATKESEQIKTPVPPAPEAKFKTLDAKHAADVSAARKDYANSHLVLGVLYAQFGLLDEAESEFTALAKSNPQSDVATKLLANIRAAKSAGKK